MSCQSTATTLAVGREEEIVDAPVGVRQHQRAFRQLGEQAPAMRPAYASPNAFTRGVIRSAKYSWATGHAVSYANADRAGIRLVAEAKEPGSSASVGSSQKAGVQARQRAQRGLSRRRR